MAGKGRLNEEIDEDVEKKQIKNGHCRTDSVRLLWWCTDNFNCLWSLG